MHMIHASILLLLTSIFAENDSQELSHYLNDQLFTQLQIHSELKEDVKPAERPSLVPLISSRQAIIDDIMNLQPTAGIEMVILYTRHVVPVDTTSDLISIYNVLSSISTLEGILYFSESRKRMRTLFTKSYVVESSESEVKIDDPLFTVLPSRSEIDVIQEDLTFGKNRYRITYQCSGKEIVMKIENTTPLKYLIFPDVRPSQFVTYIVVIPEKHRILFYGISCIHSAIFLKFFKGRLQESLYNRLKALYLWFVASTP